MSDLAVLAAVPETIERNADPAVFVVNACERAKAWLVEALEHGDIEQIVELKSQAEAIRVYTAQKQIGKDAELAAAEIVRRAEVGIATAVRRGQEATPPTVRPPSRLHGRSEGHLDEMSKLPKPVDYFSGDQERADAYVMASVPSEQFDEFIDEAKTEGNLSRANIVRKAKRERQHQAREQIVTSKSSPVRENELLYKRRRIDSNRVVHETVMTASAIASGLDLIDYTELDADRIPGWVASLGESISNLRSLRKKLTERTTRDTE